MLRQGRSRIAPQTVFQLTNVVYWSEILRILKPISYKLLFLNKPLHCTGDVTWYVTSSVQCNVFSEIKNHRRPYMNRRPTHGVHGRGMGVHAHSTPVWRWCHVPKVDTSPAIHQCHAYGIVQGRLLHANVTPMIFNWVIFPIISQIVKTNKQQQVIQRKLVHKSSIFESHYI